MTEEITGFRVVSDMMKVTESMTHSDECSVGMQGSHPYTKVVTLSVCQSQWA